MLRSKTVTRACAALLLTGAAGALEASDNAGSAGWRLKPGLLVQLWVSDLERSLRFYTETLGFQVTERRDDLQFAHLECGIPGLELGLASGRQAPRPGSMALNFASSETSSRLAWRSRPRAWSSRGRPASSPARFASRSSWTRTATGSGSPPRTGRMPERRRRMRRRIPEARMRPAAARAERSSS